jgi:branched-chain amino acid transport system substrate-binding protein
MRRLWLGAAAALLALGAAAVQAQESKPPLKIGGILDMSSLYADVTGPGSPEAAKMAAEDFGGNPFSPRNKKWIASSLRSAQ